MKNKYMKTTQGQSAQVIVAKAVAYYTGATYTNFVADAVEGALGVFIVFKNSGPTTYKEMNAIINPSDTALVAGDKFFIAQKRDGQVHKTPTYTFGELTIRSVAYVAPVKQITNIGYGSLSTTTGSINSGTLVNSQIFTIKLLETTPLNQPYPTWNYEEVSKQGDSIITIGARLLKQINDPIAAQNQYNGRLVRAELLANGTFSASSGGVFSVTQDSDIITTVESAGSAADAGKYAADASSMAIGQYLRIGGTTTDYPLYKIKAVSGIGTAAATIQLEEPYQGATNASIAAASVLVNTVAPTEIGFKFTSLLFGAHFRVALQEDAANADLVYTTTYKEGIGTSDYVAQLEDEGGIYAGHTTGNTAFDSDYGKPTTFVVDGTTYNLIFLDYLRSMPSVAAPKISDSHYGHIVIALPVGVAPATNLDGMFGTYA